MDRNFDEETSSSNILRRRFLRRLATPYLLVLMAGCATSKPPDSNRASAKRISGATRKEEVRASQISQAQSQEATLMAMAMIGTSYKYGGSEPSTGFDCSGLIYYVYRQAAGLRSPRSVRQLQSWGMLMPEHQARTGDLVFFDSQGLSVAGSESTHAGIVVEGDRFVHAPSTGGKVRIDPLNAKHWRKRIVMYRRA